MILFILVIIATVLLVYSLGFEESAPDFVRYFSYLFSAIVLGLVVYRVPSIVRRIKASKTSRKSKRALYKVPLLRKLHEDKRLSSMIALYCSGAINVFFIVTQYWNGFAHQVIWSITLATYYLLLVIMKVLLLKGLKTKTIPTKERRTARSTGILTLILNVLLSIMIAQMITDTTVSKQSLVLMIANATYTFYRIISAVINAAKTRKQNSPVLSAMKHINLIAAMVAVIMLQTTMITSLSGEVEFMQRMNGIVGLVISVVSVALSVRLIYKNRSIRAINKSAQ